MQAMGTQMEAATQAPTAVTCRTSTVQSRGEQIQVRAYDLRTSSGLDKRLSSVTLTTFMQVHLIEAPGSVPTTTER